MHGVGEASIKGIGRVVAIWNYELRCGQFQHPLHSTQGVKSTSQRDYPWNKLSVGCIHYFTDI